MGLTPGARLTLEVERPVAGGWMLARHLGQVVLVAGTIPGETVRARVTRVARGTVYADTEEVVNASPDRRPGVEGRCGGSIYSHIDYPRQVTLKAAVIEDAWRRIAHLPIPEPVRVESSHDRGYRSRARLHARDGRLGFYREGTHRLCDAAQTGQLAEGTQAWIREAEGRLHAGAGQGLVAVDVVENVSGQERACHLHVAAGVHTRQFEPLAEGLTGLSMGPAAPEAGDDDEGPPDRGVTTVAGDPAVIDVVRITWAGLETDVTLRHSARSFFQGNRFLLERLTQMVIDASGDGPLLDLFAGTGLFGLALAASGRSPVTLVEGDPSAGRDLVVNAAGSNVPVTVERRSVESYLAVPRPGSATWIVDPPRAGLSEAVRAAALRDRPSRIVYVSCDPATLARDVRGLVAGGYRVRSLVALDLFPSTAHVEAVCVLNR